MRSAERATNGCSVALWHRQPLDLSKGEPIHRCMLVTVLEPVRRGSLCHIGDDEDLTAWQYLEEPAVEDRTTSNPKPKLLLDLALNGLWRLLPRLEPAARKLPLPAVILQEHDAIVRVQEYRFDGNRELAHRTGEAASEICHGSQAAEFAPAAGRDRSCSADRDSAARSIAGSAQLESISNAARLLVHVAEV